jgi:hypothetical protein
MEIRSALSIFRPYAAVLLTMLAATITTGYLLVREQRTVWAFVPGSTGPNIKSDIIERFKSLRTGDDHIRPGAVLELLDLMTADRKHVKFFVAEADFRSSEINGLDQWKDLLNGGATLVNSVDEFRRNDGGVSKPIAEGCQLKSLDIMGAPQQIGDVVFEDCKGKYPDFGIKRVADVAIILWKENPAKAICTTDYTKHDDNGYSTDEKYRTCVSKSVETGLQSLFIKLTQGQYAPALVLPALATGTGLVHPEYIYGAYRAALTSRLSGTESVSQLPECIIFLFFRGWLPRQVSDHEQAIANLITGLHDTWSETAAKYRQLGPIATLLGISCGLTVLAFAIIIRRPRLSAEGPKDLTATQLFLALAGWGLAAQGAVTIAQTILGVFVSSSTLTSFCIGLSAVALAWIVSRSEDAFRSFS